MRPLGDIAAALGLPAHRPHVAEGDALTTAQVFLALATHLEAHGRVTVRTLTGARLAAARPRPLAPARGARQVRLKAARMSR